MFIVFTIKSNNQKKPATPWQCYLMMKKSPFNPNFRSNISHYVTMKTNTK